jgi:predicted N-acyltransferase
VTLAGTVKQFQWTNPGWHSFDEYLAAFRSKRRVQIKRERREATDPDTGA